MNHRTFASILSLAIAATSPAADPVRSWDDLIAELRGLDRVSGSAVSYGGTPTTSARRSRGISGSSSWTGRRRQSREVVTAGPVSGRTAR